MAQLTTMPACPGNASRKGLPAVWRA